MSSRESERGNRAGMTSGEHPDRRRRAKRRCFAPVSEFHYQPSVQQHHYYSEHPTPSQQGPSSRPLFSRRPQYESQQMGHISHYNHSGKYSRETVYTWQQFQPHQSMWKAQGYHADPRYYPPGLLSKDSPLRPGISHYDYSWQQRSAQPSRDHASAHSCSPLPFGSSRQNRDYSPQQSQDYHMSSPEPQKQQQSHWVVNPAPRVTSKMSSIEFTLIKHNIHKRNVAEGIPSQLLSPIPEYGPKHKRLNHDKENEALKSNKRRRLILEDGCAIRKSEV